jgi:hypothetical protein
VSERDAVSLPREELVDIASTLVAVADDLHQRLLPVHAFALEGVLAALRTTLAGGGDESPQ